MCLSQTGKGIFTAAYDHRFMRIMIIGAVALVAAIAVAAPASADDPPGDGSPCQGTDIGNTATASDGTTVRCIADEYGGFSWTDTGAAETIAGLQQQGYQVQIIRIGGGPLQHCQVASIGQPHIDTRADRSGPGDNVTTIVLNKTIPVTLDCRAMS